MAQARHVECTAPPPPPPPHPFSHLCVGVSNGVPETDNGVNPAAPPPLPLVICLHRCIPVHSIPAEQPPPPPPPPSSLSLSLSLTHTHQCTVTCQQGSGGRRPLLLPLQERGVIQQGGRLPHPPNPTGTPIHSHTHTQAHTQTDTDRQAHALTYSYLPRTEGVATCCIIQETSMALGNQVSLQCQRRAAQSNHCWT